MSMLLQACVSRHQTSFPRRRKSDDSPFCCLKSLGFRLRGNDGKVVARLSADRGLDSLFDEAQQKLTRPVGRRTGCAPFFDRGRMPSRKIASEHHTARCGLCPKGISLVTFLTRASARPSGQLRCSHALRARSVPAKKVTRRKAEAFRLTSNVMRSGRSASPRVQPTRPACVRSTSRTQVVCKRPASPLATQQA